VTDLRIDSFGPAGRPRFFVTRRTKRGEKVLDGENECRSRMPSLLIAP
jgi:hypothetical protein